MPDFYAVCCKGYPLCSCIILVPHFDWKRRLLFCNRVFYATTFERYCKFIYFIDDTSFELFSLDNVCCFLNNQLENASTWVGETCARVGNIRSDNLSSGKKVFNPVVDFSVERLCQVEMTARDVCVGDFLPKAFSAAFSKSASILPGLGFVSSLNNLIIPI